MGTIQAGRHPAGGYAEGDRTAGAAVQAAPVRKENGMPRGSNAKRERQYEHIKEGAEKRGTSEGRAKEIAARTVNKERARKGEAKESSRSSTRDMSSGRRGGLRGSGARSERGRTKEQLYNEAKRMGIQGRSKMNKQQLQRAVDRRK